ncbi:hypothetical protein VSDG_08739 [Cytospora chrysosperma]|uniref:Major facilitator superfamily (MFS) profile domain-containing protein n=1 Tax=Cytospora chrysosperma TaxID=252740 RepID=A0A423VDL8_CYTCH|nr:hypothetical protein VSDG_08739 [Valsa sordida]
MRGFKDDGAVKAREEIEFDIDSSEDGGEGGGEEEGVRLLKTEEAFRYEDGAVPSNSSATCGPPALGTGANSTAGIVQSTTESRRKKERLKKPRKNEKVSWKDLPHKQQLLVITLTRLSEPLVQTSLQAYMFYQLKWFDPSLPDPVIASQAGVLHASFTAAQFLTAMAWGRVADSRRAGRKTVVLVGLAGTMASCLGFGLSTTFWQALAFRCLGGATNGNVGVLRTMISEIVRDKRHHARAFLLLPMTFNVGVILGPVIGGLLADPAGSYPAVFGGVAFFQRFPYALPNLVSAFFLFSASLAAWLCLEETLDARADRPDWGIELGKKIGSALSACFSRSGSTSSAGYAPLAGREGAVTSIEMTHSRNTSTASTVSTMSTTSTPTSLPTTTAPRSSTTAARRRARYTQRLPFRRIFTRNVSLTLLSHSFLAFHLGTFQSLWFVFLSTPAYDPASGGGGGGGGGPPRRLPFAFTGGLGLPPAQVGAAMSILGVLGIALQLLAYPALSARLGTVWSLRVFLPFFPLAYLLVPFLALVPGGDPGAGGGGGGGGAKSGPAVWAAICGVLLCQVVARTFALPNMTILVNNCTPHPSVLGTMHGAAQSCSSAARTVGPVLCGFLYGLGLARGVVGAVWWGLAGWALVGWLTSFLLREGDGHEIWLEGDEGDDAGGDVVVGEAGKERGEGPRV